MEKKTSVETAIPDELYQFVKNYADDHYCLELLRFFGAYPQARFSRLAVLHASKLNGEKLYIEAALRRLIGRGVVKGYTTTNVPVYSLTKDEPLRSLVLNLTRLDWHQWQSLLSQTYPDHTKTVQVLSGSF